MMALVLVVGVASGGIVRLMRRAEAQRTAVGALRNAICLVWYDWQWKDGRLLPQRHAPLSQMGEPAHRDRLSERCRRDHRLDPLSDALMIHVGRLSGLEELDLSQSAVTDSGILQLRGLKNLRVLKLTDTAIGDAGLAHLSRLTNLRVLNLDGNAISDAGLTHLSGLSNLLELSLEDTGLTDAGLIHLKGLMNLRFLNLKGTRVSFPGVQDLQRSLPKVKLVHYFIPYAAQASARTHR